MEVRPIQIHLKAMREVETKSNKRNENIIVVKCINEY